MAYAALLIVIALGLGALGFVLWKRSPRGDATPPLPQMALDMGLVGREVENPVAPALPASVRPVLDFEGPPGRVVMAKPEVVIGRHSEDDVKVSDVRVSRHHARLVLRPDGRYELVNETASRSDPNPVLVNGDETARTELHDGDVVTLGGPSFVFRLEPA